MYARTLSRRSLLRRPGRFCSTPDGRWVASLVVKSGKGNGRSQTFPFPTKRVSLRQGEVAYFDSGSGEPMIFVHGLVGDFTHFEHIVGPLSRHFRVMGLDMPGCGLSCKPDVRHTIDRYADVVIEFMDRMKLDRATLVGHSAGGQVVAHAALAAPERVSKLVLVDAAGMRRFPPALRQLALSAVKPWLLSRTLDWLAMPMLGQVFVVRNAYTEKFVKDSLDRPLHPTMHEMAKVFSDLAPDLLSPTIVENAAHFKMPVLVVWGDKDRLIPKESVTEVAARLPRVTLQRIPGCGHMPMIECPDRVVRAISDFCEAGAVTREIAV
jgi:pimeloyl-ACP methyl ester carboxylesterase